MCADKWSKHSVRGDGDRILKNFAEGEQEGAAREWEALQLLARYAPGLAPLPLGIESGTDRTVIAMSRLEGSSLRGVRLNPEQVSSLAAAVDRMYRSVPREVLEALELRPWHQAGVIQTIRKWTPAARKVLRGSAGEALEAGLRWLEASEFANQRSPDVPPVFGPGDGNLANYLWAGGQVKVVDFEDSGRSDRAFELAEITEHVGSWVEHPLDVDLFLSHFELSAAEASRLADCRRLLSLTWLFLLIFDEAAEQKNPPGTVSRQAQRVMELLG
ncbi:phosphotransferase [Streptomyces tendae]|uniref:phosphotransferase family protein n=1 Tax=Streptomyces tendae TaxID=1932 RepID=UPI00340C7807